MGLSPSYEMKRIVQKTASRRFNLSIPQVLSFGLEESSSTPKDIPDFVDSLKFLIKGVRTKSSFLLFIDGLDEILTRKNLQLDTLSALIYESARLNQFFKKSRLNAKIIVLVRADLFDVIPGPNKNKLKQDYSIFLDWYEDLDSPEYSELVQLVNLRASLSLKRNVDIFTEFFPLRIRGKNIYKFLLANTRYTPRDILRLMYYIQKYMKGYQDYIDEREIISGIRGYSREYFISEVYDEVDGFISRNTLQIVFNKISMLRKAEFIMEELFEVAKEIDRDELVSVMKKLYDCSAVGNVIENKSKSIRYYSFKFRNIYSEFSDKDGVCVHIGLRKALNLP